MILEEFAFGPGEGGLHRLHLVEDVDAVAVVLQHTDQAAHLTLDAFQTFNRVFGTHHLTNTLLGYI